jgi:UDP-glucuronate decarboxylase
MSKRMSIAEQGPKPRTLVAGGAGFLGSHLCDRLLEAGRQVVCIDSLLTGGIANVAHLLSHPGFSLVRRDIIDPLPDLGKIDEIYNLACAASPPLYQRDPIHTLKTSVMGSLNLLDLAIANRARIFMASTSEVYGDPTVHPQPEDYRGNVNPHGPRACYDEGKRCAETLFFDYRRVHGLSIRVARIFNTYGPRMRADDGRVVSNFIVQALRSEDLTIYGQGSQTRSFCYVDDLIEGIVRLMAIDEDPATPVNLGNPVELTVGDLAERILRLTGSSSRLVHRPLPVDDPRQRRPDIALAARLLGWAPAISLEEGLARTVGHFQMALGSAAAGARS